MQPDQQYQEFLKTQTIAEPAPTGGGGYDEYLREQMGQSQALRSTMLAAGNKTPEQAARNKYLSQATGLPLSVVESDDGYASAQAKYAELVKASQSSPILAAQLRDPQFLALSQNDLPKLSEIEQVTRHLFGAPRALLSGLATDFNSASWAIAENTARLLGSDQWAGKFNYQRKTSESLGKQIQGDYGSGGFIEGGVASGFRSFGAMVPSTILSLMTGGGGVMLGSAGIQAGGQAMGKGIDQGLDPWKTLQYGASDAAAEILTELLPVGMLFKDLKAGTPFFKLLGRQILTEVPTELAATTWQNANEWLYANPTKSFDDYIKQLPADLAQTAISTVVMTVLSAGMAKGGAVMLGYEREAAKAEEHAKAIQQLQQALMATDILRHDPASLRTYAQSLMDDKVPTVYLDLAQAEKAGIDLQALAKDVPSVREQLATLTPGGTLAIPTGELLIDTAGKDYGQALLENMRTSENGMSRAEAADWLSRNKQEMDAKFQKDLGQYQVNDEFMASAERVRALVEQQVVEAGAYTPQMANVYSRLIGNHVAVRAAQLGTTPEQLFLQRGQGLSVVSDMRDTAYDQGGRRPGALSVDGYHYSPQDLTSVSTAMYGRGLKGSGQDQYLGAQDQRLARRSYFYVDKGTGINPEAGVGGRAHRAKLSNIYDSNADPLRLKVGRDQLAFESAVLDAGFSGYLDRLEGTQSGQVVMLGNQNVPVESLGPMAATRGTPVAEPMATMPQGRDAVVEALQARKDLPGGELALSRWDEILAKLAPEQHAAMKEAGVFEGSESVYKDGLVRRMIDLTEAPMYGQRTMEDDRAYRNWEPEVTSTGKIKGAPEWVNTKEDHARLRRDLRKFLREGVVGRYWYEDSAKAVIAMVDNDVVLAEKFIQLLAIYSPNSNVWVNTIQAVRAFTHWKTGQPRETFRVGSGDGDGKAVSVLYDDVAWDGRKTNSFYLNLMHDIVERYPDQVSKLNLDPEFATAISKPATIDVWMLRAFGYQNEQASDDKGTGKYSFAENEVRRIAARLNAELQDGEPRWTPHQVQASIWTAMKTRYEFSDVMAKTNERSIHEGLITFDDAGKIVYPKRAAEKRQHLANWRHFAMQKTTDEVVAAAEESARSFGDDLMRMTEIVTWEAIPSASVGAEINNASDAVKRKFTGEAMTLLLDGNGDDVLAQKLGVALSYDFLSDGAYEGSVNPNTLSHLIPARPKAADGFNVDEVRAYARAIQFIFKQDAVPWFRPENRAITAKSGIDAQKFVVYNKETGRTAPGGKFETQAQAEAFMAAKGDGFAMRGGQLSRAVVLTFTENLDGAKMAALLSVLQKHLGQDAGYTRTSDNQVVIVNFRDDETKLPFARHDEEFLDLVNDLATADGEALGLSERKAIWTQGEYGNVHDWSKDGEGLSLLDAGGLAGRSDLQEWIRGRRTAFNALLQQYIGEGLAAAERSAADQRAEAGRRRDYGQEARLEQEPQRPGREVNQNGLTPDEQRLSDELQKRVKDQPELVDQYIAKNGNLIDADLAKRLFPEYLADEAAMAKVAHEASSDLANAVYRRLLATMPDDTTVLLTAGGGGSGKSETLGYVMRAAEVTLDKAIVFDSVLGNTESAIKKKIKPAIDTGKKVTLVYTNRDVRDAWAFAMARPRVVPFRTIAGAHLGASKTIRQLAEMYQGNENVDIAVINNTGALTDIAQGTIADVPQYDPQNVERSLYAIAVQARNEGRITAERFVQLTSDLTEADHRRLAGSGAGAPQATAGGDDVNAGGRTGSYGQAQQRLSTESPAFRKWFGDSKVVDDQGRPLVVYHFTTDDFDKFNVSRYGAIWFSNKPQYTAPSKAGLDGGRTIPVYLKLTNPARLGFEEIQLLAAADVQRLKDAGHDGAVLDDDVESPFSEVVVFSPEQIKSAIGNNGNFDPNDANVLNQGRRGGFDPINTVMKLLKDADPSTFIHETGHYFFEADIALAEPLLARMAQGEVLTDGEMQLVNDVAGIMRYGGMQGSNLDLFDQWAQMDIEQRRPIHEKMAESFERYIMEGKAPSVEMQSMFRQMKNFMLSVYQSIKQFLTRFPEAGSLNDEVRGIFDRMLATVEDIKLAEQTRNMEAMFESAMDAGMTKEEFAAYQRMGDDAKMAAVEELEARRLRDLQWLQNSRSKEIARLQRQHDSVRREVRREVRAQVMAEPIYRAWAFLTSRDDRAVTPGAESPEAGSAKLRTAELVEMYGNAEDAPWRTLSKRGMTSDARGISPVAVADMFGFESADAMVRQLAEANDPAEMIEQLTDGRMLREHADLATPEALRDAADRAIHNDARIRMVATEMAALERAGTQRKGVEGKPRSTVDVMAAAAKEFAAKVVGRTRVRDLRPAVYASAAQRASREAMNSRGDLGKAHDQKRNQLVNLQAAREAYKAREEVAKAIKYFRKVQGLESIPEKHRNQIKSLLARFDLSDTTLKQLDRISLYRTWAKEQLDAGMIPPNVERLLSPEAQEAYLTEASRKDDDGALVYPNEEDQALLLASYIDQMPVRSYKEATVDEIMGLRDTIKQIEHIGRRTQKVLTDRKNRLFSELVGEIRNRITEVAEKKGRVAMDTRSANDAIGRLGQQFRGFFFSHIKAATLVNIMDGGEAGPMWEALIQSANEAGNAEVLDIAKAHDAVQALLKPVKDIGAITDKAVFFPAINRSLNRQARLAMAMNMGNDGNIQRLLDGEGWTMEQIQPVLATLTTADWQFVQGMWDFYESYRPRVGEIAKEVDGQEPDWVEPRQLKVTTVDGQELTLRGGYAPIVFDPRASGQAAMHAAAKDAKQMLQAARVASTVNKSFTKSRVDEVKGRPLMLSLDPMIGAIQDTVHYVHWQKWVIDANRILRSLDPTIREHYGSEVMDQLKQWVTDSAAGMRPARTGAERAMVEISRNVSFAGLAFNVVSAAKQLTGLGQSAAVVGSSWMSKGLAHSIASPRGAYLEALEKSDFMKKRASTRMRDIAEVRSTVQDAGVIRTSLDKWGYSLMLTMQTMVDVPTWWAGYEKAIAAGQDEQTAVNLADQAVIDSQGSGTIKDQAAVERATGAMRLFTGFMSFMITTANVNYRVLKSDQGVAEKAVNLLLVNTFPVIAGAIIQAALTPGGGDEPEDIAKKIMEDQVGFMLGQFVGLREFSPLVQAATGGPQGEYGGPVGTRIVDDALTLAKQVGQGEMDDALRKAVINFAGTAFRLPSAQANRTITGVKAVMEGDVEPGPATVAAPFFGYKKQ